MYWTLYSGPITYSARVPCTLCHKKPGTDGCCSSVLRVIPCLFCLSCILRSVRHWIWYLCSTYGWTDRWGVNVCDSLLHKCYFCLMYASDWLNRVSAECVLDTLLCNCILCVWCMGGYFSYPQNWLQRESFFFCCSFCALILS